MKKLAKIVLRILGVLILLVALLLLLLRLQSVQKFAIDKVAIWFSEKTDTDLSIGNIKVNLRKQILLEDVLLREKSGDTIAVLGLLKLDGERLLKEDRIIQSVEIKKLHARINRSEKDGSYNIDPIINAFTGDTTDKKNESSPFSLDLRDLNMEDVDVQFVDRWIGQAQYIKLGKLHLLPEELDFGNMNFRIHNVQLEEPDVTMVYTDKSIYNEIEVRKKEAVQNAQKKSPLIALAKLQLKNGHFHYVKPNEAASPDRKFNEKDIDIHGIQLQAHDFRADSTGLDYVLDQLIAQDHSGLGIRNFQSNVHMSSERTDFRNSDLDINRSELNGDLSFEYGSLKWLSFFIDSVKMDIQLRNSLVSTDDISYFSQVLAPWHLNALLDVDFQGTVSEFDARVKRLMTTRGTLFQGRIAMEGLPDIEKTQMHIQAENLVTNMVTVSVIAPELNAIEAVDFHKLGKIYFQGKFDGQYTDFLVDGKVSSNKGFLRMEPFHLDMKDPKHPTYSGTIDFHDVNLQGFIPDLPGIQGDGHVVFDAHGFDLDKMYIDAESKIKRLIFDEVSYANLDFKGRIRYSGIEAMIKSNSEKFQGNVDFSLDLDRQNLVKIDGDIVRLDLQAMNLIDEPLVVQAIAKGQFQGDYDKNLLGQLQLQNALIEYADTNLAEPLLILRAETQESRSDYSLTTATLEARLKGFFGLSDLMPLVQNKIYSYIPAYAEKPDRSIDPNTSVDLFVQGSGINKYLTFIDKDLSIEDSLYFTAEIRNNFVKVVGMLPRVRYQNYDLDELSLDMQGDNEMLSNKLYANQVLDQGQLLSNEVNLDAQLYRNNIDLQINTLDNKENLNTLQGSVMAMQDTFKFILQPSSIFLNNSQWVMASEGYSYLHGRNLNVARTNISSELGEFVLQSENYPGEEFPVLNLSVRDIEGNKVIELFQSGKDLPAFSTQLSGNIDVFDPMQDLLVEADLQLNEFEIENREIGNIILQAEYLLDSNKIMVRPSSGIDNGERWVKIYGDIGLDSLGDLGLVVNAADFDISPFEPFLDDYLSDIQGLLDADVHVTGTFDEYKIIGDMKMDSASFDIPMIGNSYRIPSLRLNFDEYLFQTDTTYLYDEANNVAKLSGLLAHQNLNNLRFLINLWSDKFRVLQSTRDQNDMFYGDMTTKLNAVVSGTLKDLVLSLDVKPVGENELYVINSDGVGDPALDAIEFRGIDEMRDTTLLEVDSSSFRLNVTANVDENTAINYILDEANNSNIVVRGFGNIDLDLPMGFGSDEKEMMITGGYEVEDGKIVYQDASNLELSQLAGTKIFQIQPGSSILLTGDPMDARISAKATSLIQVANIQGIFSSQLLDEIKRSSPATTAEIYKSQDVEIAIVLTDATIDDLNNIRYNISLPDINENNTYISSRLARINADPNESQKQVVSLLLFNSFLAEDNVSTRMVLNTALGNTANIFTSRISNSLNQAFKNFTNFENLELGVGLRFEDDTSEFSSEQSYLPVLNVNGRVKLLDDRLVLKVGYDINLGSNASATASNSSTDLITGDYKLEYQLDPSQDLLAYVYRNSSYDPLLSTKGKINRSGVGLSYAYSFDRWAEIGRSARARRAEKKELRKEKKADNNKDIARD